MLSLLLNRKHKIKKVGPSELTLPQSLPSEATAQMPTAYSGPHTPAQEYRNVMVQTIKTKCQKVNQEKMTDYKAHTTVIYLFREQVYCQTIVLKLKISFTIGLSRKLNRGSKFYFEKLH